MNSLTVVRKLLRTRINRDRLIAMKDEMPIDKWMRENPEARITHIIKRMQALEKQGQDGNQESKQLLNEFFEIVGQIEGLPPITIIEKD